MICKTVPFHCKCSHSIVDDITPAVLTLQCPLSNLIGNRRSKMVHQWIDLWFFPWIESYHAFGTCCTRGLM